MGERGGGELSGWGGGQVFHPDTFLFQHLSDAKKAQQNLESSFKHLESVSRRFLSVHLDAVVLRGPEGEAALCDYVSLSLSPKTKKRFAKEWAEADKATQQAEKIENDVNATKLDVEKVNKNGGLPL